MGKRMLQFFLWNVLIIFLAFMFLAVLFLVIGLAINQFDLLP